jgi:aminoglycoside phosphotransferase (APT) family kinase protein
MHAADASDGSASLAAALARMGLVAPGETPVLTPMVGGVSSDICRVDLASGPVCVKRALPRLKVAADWRAPVGRNRFEVAWMREAGKVLPQAVPAILGEDAEACTFAMAFLDPALYPVWKAQLRDGIVEPATAAQVGRRIAAIHNATAHNAAIAAQFPTDAIFFSIRLEPYLAATAKRHADCAQALDQLVTTTAARHIALVHGDVSPKNILVGKQGPVFLDAECAWYGDPAFDLAFCLNHLLLKCLWRPQWCAGYLACFDALSSGYLDAVRWEPRAAIEERTAHLLAGLFLGRVDGKSPVEYLSAEADKDKVRRVARHFLIEPAERLEAIRTAWKREIGK